jgi:hypothetical protein
MRPATTACPLVHYEIGQLLLQRMRKVVDDFFARVTRLRLKNDIKPLEAPEELGARCPTSIIALLYRDANTQRLGDREFWRMFAKT